MTTETSAKSKFPPNLAGAFLYLDDLRASGVTNMYGAAPYVERAFSYREETARAVLSAWMATFDDTPAADRAAKARGQS